MKQSSNSNIFLTEQIKKIDMQIVFLVDLVAVKEPFCCEKLN